MKIMIADDNDFSANLLQELINRTDFEFIRAKSGAEALAIYEASPENDIDYILMDIIMEQGHGDTAAVAIRNSDRADAKSVKIYATTALKIDDQIGEGKTFTGALYKPFKKTDIDAIFS